MLHSTNFSSAKGCFDNLTISNLDLGTSDFNIPSFENNTKSSLFEIVRYNISMNGHYNLRGNIGDLFDVFGNGLFW